MRRSRSKVVRSNSTEGCTVLVNREPLAADARIGAPVPGGARLVLLTAKATFRTEPGGALVFDTERPEPIRDADEVTDLGVFPNDRSLRDDGPVDVFVYGSARSEGGRPTRSMWVTVRIGSLCHRLRVVGDRTWQRTASGFVATDPVPFVGMPIVWERAYGGRCVVDLSPTSRTEFVHAPNPQGIGFLPYGEVADLRSQGIFSAGFPRFPVAGVSLPNLVFRERGSPKPNEPEVGAAWSPLPCGVFPV